MKCVICNNNIDVQGTYKEGHNALPIAKGRCCTNCNESKVLPARVDLKAKGIKREDYDDVQETIFEDSAFKKKSDSDDDSYTIELE